MLLQLQNNKSESLDDSHFVKKKKKKTIFYDNDVNFIPRDVLEVLQRQILTLTLQYEQVSAPGKTNVPFFRFQRNRFFFL